MLSKAKKQQTRKRAGTTKELTERTLKKLDTLSSQVFSRNADEIAVQFFALIHEFFGEYCRIRYEFTYNELIKEIRKRKAFEEFLQEKVIDLINQLQEKEFSNTELSKEDLKRYISELRPIVKACKGQESGQQRFQGSFMSRVRLRIHSIGKRLVREEASQIFLLLGELEKCVKEGDVENAQKTYKQIDKLYQRLSSEEQKTVFGSISKGYERVEEAYANMLLQDIEEKQRKFYEQLESNDTAAAEQEYEEIRRLYEELPEVNKKRIYREMAKTHGQLQENILKNRTIDIRRLLTQAVISLKEERVGHAERSYHKAHILYEESPGAVQKKVYPRLRTVYERISQEG